MDTEVLRLVSGLSVNFEKSCLYGINLDRERVEEMTKGWGCKVRVIPIPYLGMKVGGRINRAEGWADVVEKVKGRVKKWDAKRMSMGGKITVIKSILSTIPIYNMSFLPLPKLVEKRIKSIQHNFLWGGDEETKKVAWVKWDDICCSVKNGGLGIRNLGAFNKALLNKWIWRFLGEGDRL